MSERMTRREFVRTVSVVLAGSAAVSVLPGCAGGGDDTGRETATPSSTYGGDAAMSERVLVGYATRTGSTVEVAEAIGEVLGKRGYAVDVKPLKERPSVEGYDAFVLGSAINGGSWLEEALRFVETNKAALGKVPVAAFCVHAMNLGDDAKSRAKRLAYIDKVRDLVEPVDEGYFAGVGPTSEDSSLIARWAFRAFGGGIEGDGRDWDAIREWAQRTHV